jgi:ribosomal protein S18 acetylase RimI-like enzyme
MSWTIRLANLAEANRLPPLENSAGQRFRTIPHLAWLADGDDMSVDRHRLYIAQGTEWVALGEDGELVGFLAAELIRGDLHIWELAVGIGAQNRGIGRRLIDIASAFAQDRRLGSLTLTTFADVPWNAPWYSRLGFHISSDDERLAALVRMETERGMPGRCAMRKTMDSQVRPDFIVVSEGEAPEIEAFLAERIYEYNAKATGYFDGKSFSATRRDESGVIQAGVSGYTWGGCCYVSYLWVEASERGRGVGAALVGAVEGFAASKGCKVILLATHNFQAPGFYERMGYEKQAVVHDHPVGYSNIVLAKRLN